MARRQHDKDKERRDGQRRILPLLVVATTVGCGSEAAACSAKAEFSIPEGHFDEAVIKFAQQAEVSVLFPVYSVFDRIKTNALIGSYCVEEGLKILFEGTAISASIDAGLLTFTRAETTTKSETRGREMAGKARTNSNRNILATAMAAAFASTVGATVAQAQDTAGAVTQDVGQEGPVLEEISVTGSRIRQTGMQTPTPVTALDMTELEMLSPGTLMDQLDQLPQFINSNTLENASAWTNTGGQSTLNLRGVGGNRTLVLLNGRRVVPSNRLSTVDISMFPQALIRRTDVVTGGASAAYGSDAISGVVNFILDTEFEGMSGSVQGGISDVGDRETGRYSLSGGFRLGERAHVVMGGEYYNAKGIPNYDDRDWYQHWGDINYGATGGVPNRTPQRVRVPNIISREYTLGGLIVSGPLAGTQFLSDGTPAPFVDGEMLDATATTALRSGRIAGSHVGGNASGDQIERDWQVLAPQERGSLFTHVKFDLDENTELSLQGIYGVGEVRARKGGYIFSRPLDEITIYQDNAFLPEELRDRMIAGGVESFTFRKQVSTEDLLNNSGEGAPQKTTMFSLTAALDGAIGNSGWNYSTYYQYGESVRDLRLYGHRNDRTWRAIDSVRHPETGEIVCRSTLSVPDDGCVPLNIFGRNNESQAARDYVHNAAFTETKLTQHAAEIVVDGSLFDLWAGPVSVATGLSYRKDYLDQMGCDVGGCPIPLVGEGPVHTPLDENGNPIYRGLPAAMVGRQIMDLTTGARIVGGFDVKEAFAETQIPLLRGLPAAESIDLTLAARYADYQGSGGIWAWKMGLDWRIFSDARFRLTRSRDIRAASLAERYDVSTGGGNVTDPFLDGAVYIVSTMQGGNPNVLPEHADTLTFGVVYEPSWFPDFSISADVYDIQLTNAISILSLDNIVNECYRAGAFCNLINRDANGLIQTVRNIYINVDEARTTGLDLEMQYSRPIDLFGGNESIRLRAIGSHLAETSITPYIGDKIDSVGVGDFADWQVMLSASYLRGPLSVAWTENWRSAVKRDRLWVTGIDVDNNRIPSQSTSNLRVTYTLDQQSRTYSLFGMVSNVFDRDPSRVMGLNNIWGDIGRTYTLGVNFRY